MGNFRRRKDLILDILAIVIIAGFFGMILLIALTKMDNSDHDILYTMLGVLGSAFSQVCQYYFGSSRSIALGSSGNSVQ